MSCLENSNLYFLFFSFKTSYAFHIFMKLRNTIIIEKLQGKSHSQIILLNTFVEMLNLYLILYIFEL